MISIPQTSGLVVQRLDPSKTHENQHRNPGHRINQLCVCVLCSHTTAAVSPAAAQLPSYRLETPVHPAQLLHCGSRICIWYLRLFRRQLHNLNYLQLSYYGMWLPCYRCCDPSTGSTIGSIFKIRIPDAEGNQSWSGVGRFMKGFSGQKYV